MVVYALKNTCKFQLAEYFNNIGGKYISDNVDYNYKLKFSTLMYCFKELVKKKYFPEPNTLNMAHADTFNLYLRKYFCHNFQFLSQ